MLSDKAQLVLVALIAIGSLAVLAWKVLRGERVGSLRLPCRLGQQFSVTNLTVAREAQGTRAPAVQLRVSVQLSFTVHPLDAAGAQQLASLLEAAAARSRAA